MLQEEQRVELRQIPDDALPRQDADQHDEDRLQVVRAGEGLLQRRLGEAAFVADFFEQRRFIELEPNPQRDHQQHGGKQEGNAPSPIGEGSLPHRILHDDDDAQREDEADGCGKLNPSGRCAAFVRGRMFGNIDGRAAIFAADGKPLQHAQADQQPWRCETDGVRIGKKAGDERRQAHHRDGDEEGALAACAVAEPSKKHRAKGAREEACREGQKGEDVALRLTGAGEEVFGNDRRNGAVDEEVIPFEHRARGRRDNDETHAAILRRNIG